MANEQIQRYDWNTGRKSLNGEHVMYSDHVAATNELREGQMHLAMELERKDEQIRKLREENNILDHALFDACDCIRKLNFLFDEEGNLNERFQDQTSIALESVKLFPEDWKIAARAALKEGE